MQAEDIELVNSLAVFQIVWQLNHWGEHGKTWNYLIFSLCHSNNEFLPNQLEEEYYLFILVLKNWKLLDSYLENMERGCWDMSNMNAYERKFECNIFPVYKTYSTCSVGHWKKVFFPWPFLLCKLHLVQQFEASFSFHLII